MLLKIDLHVHTCYSHDCATSLKDVLLFAKRNGLNGVAITDHDTIEGAIRLVEMGDTDGIIVLPGIEVSTLQGHILGINLRTNIPSHQDITETVKMIHEAGGIAIAAHPSAIYKNGVGLRKNLISFGIDAIEVINSQAFPFSLLTYLNRRLASKYSLPQTGGSDSHIPETIGLSYTLLGVDAKCADSDMITDAIKNKLAIPFGRAAPLTLNIKKRLKRIKKEWLLMFARCDTSLC
ncbi:MAG: CehA/McbA family metallohydrolase [Nitrososphaerota archaeon]|nr:CehA/McbA family metallohydrolase [Nitrososphaerota archaeon]